MANYPTGTHMAGPLKLGVKSMLLNGDEGGLSAAVTLGADESNGQHYILDGGTGFAITLPAATKGWSCKFTVGAVFSTDFTLIANTAGTINGSIIEAGLVQLVAAADQIVIEDNLEVLGDTIEFWSDGTSIFTFGAFSGAAATPS